MSRSDSALRAAARIGPYFVWEPWDGTPGWRPLADLLDPGVVTDRVDVARRSLARMGGLEPDDIAERVVASIVFLGLASRLLSPPLAAAVAGDALPGARADRMFWRPVDGGPMPIAYRDLTAETCAGQDPATVAAVLTGTVVRGLAEPILEVFRDRFTLSPQVLWGNVASALGGATGMITDAEPALAARTAAVVGAMLELPPLRGTATLNRPDPARDRWFLVRRNCCLYYRIPGGGTCGDCVLTPEETRRRHWRSILAR
ncbi:(2Fe-2S)-binding protein [Actinoplanes sp. NPDC024001]|uniref:(2Fe-2S)-binding protein n=1 Tax=Actinoplanes sp. NPDC024001 TaxID=3154598 RepID=UPI0033D442A5